jgi:DnaK suppressor protein
VKAPAKKTKAPAKPAVKSKAAARPAPKAPVKPAAKVTAKGKVAAKPAAKKPVAKPVVNKKPAAKPAPAKSKAAVKTPAKAAKPSKAVAKPAGTKPAVPAKTAPKAIPKKGAVKPVSKPIPKAVAKPVAKPAKVVAPAKPSKEAKAAKPLPGDKKTAPSIVAPAPAPVPAPVQRSTLMTAPAPLKPGRRSSARATSQSPPPAPMVPTHAPDAAKASYSTIAERVIAPPPHVAAKKDPKLANNWKTRSGEELSDEEVKAMPDAEYMNEKQLAFFRHKLSILKQEIHNSAGETTEHLREDTVVVPDPADRATIEEEHALELRTRDRERKLLKKIEQSIARIDSGDYGYCDETGEPIGVGRLIARPTANLSLEAQQRRELKQKMFGD